MRRQIAQLAGFVDQAGLFLANGPVTNKLHFASLPGMVLVGLDASWNSARGNSTAEPHGSSLNDEFEGVAVAPDMGGAEMAADHQGRGIGKAREQFAPRYRRLDRIGIRGRRPVEMRHLAGMVGDVAGERAGFLVR